MSEVSHEDWSVVDYLNATDYKVNNKYVPSLFALKFVNFIKLVNGEEGEENKTPVVHLKMLDTMALGETRVTNLCHRGIAKTTVMAEYLFLYIATYGKLDPYGDINLALYVSDSIDNGVKNMRKNLESRYENSDFLKKYVPHMKLTDIRWEFRNIDGHVFIVKGYGAKTGVRGAKELGTRPQLAILDDLVSDEDARSATVIGAIEDTVYKAVTYALHPKKNVMIWSGTPFNARDPLYKAVESGAWKVNVFPVCEKFPCEKEEFRGSWEDRFTYEYVLNQYNIAKGTGKIDTFNQELMLRIMSDDDRLILDEDIHWYSKRSLMRNKGNFNFYITTDFATSEAASADLSVISVWAYNNKGQWFFVDGVCRRQLMDANMDNLFTLCAKYKPESVGIEVTGQQGGFIPWLQEKMMDRNIFFTLASDNNNNSPGIRPNTNKMVRFNVIVPEFKMGNIFWPKEDKDTVPVKEAMSELTLASPGGFKSKKDDFIDTISMLAVMKPWKPSSYSSDEQFDMLWDASEPNHEESGYSNYVV